MWHGGHYNGQVSSGVTGSWGWSPRFFATNRWEHLFKPYRCPHTNLIGNHGFVEGYKHFFFKHVLLYDLNLLLKHNNIMIQLFKTRKCIRCVYRRTFQLINYYYPEDTMIEEAIVFMLQKLFSFSYYYSYNEIRYINVKLCKNLRNIFQ